MIEPFVYTGLPARVVFGSGTIDRLSDEATLLKATRVLVLTTPEQADQGERVAGLLDDLSVGCFSGAKMHTPVEVTREALSVVELKRADCVLAIGGGSTTGLGKAIALHTDLPQIVVPTTYAGSEMTPILGQTEKGVKTTLRSPRVLPETVVYDVDLTLTLPPVLSGISGINAIAHAVEALYAQDKNPILSLIAEQGIAALAHSLPVIASAPTDRDARTDALYGAWLCAICLGSSGVALHHKLCHVLGGSFDLPHAATHTIILPHALAYNAPSVPDAVAAVSRAVEAEDPARALYDLAVQVGGKTALKDIGMPEDGIDRAVEITMQSPYWNPHPIEPAGIRTLLVNAWRGAAPSITGLR
jgi:alcohol dehydrogenase class IV